METTQINIRVPDDVLERIDAQAGREGLTRTALLLRPWVGGEGAVVTPPVPGPKRAEAGRAAPGSRTVVTRAERAAPATAAKGRVLIGFDAVTGKEIYR